MPRLLEDLSGRQFGRLTVVGVCGQYRRQRKWLCQCSCGNLTALVSSSLKSGKTRSCGCLWRDTVARRCRSRATHGMTNTPTYVTWQGMIARCTRPTDASYIRYGGMGIAVCDKWRKFSGFLEDMGPRPEGHTLDRIDPTGNYEPGNCRWATQKQQSHNTRSNRRFTHNGMTMTVSEWAEHVGINRQTLFSRLYHGWDFVRAITTR